MMARSVTHTFHRFAVPSGSRFRDRVRHCPVFVPDFHEPHRSLGSMPGRFKYIGTSSRDWIFCACTDDDRLGADRRKPVDMRADVNLHHVVFGQYL